MTTSSDPHAELLAAGWKRCFIADEPRLSEAVETYQEIGYQVRLLPVPLDEGECTECMRRAPERFKVIYVRRSDSHSDGPNKRVRNRLRSAR